MPLPALFLTLATLLPLASFGDIFGYRRVYRFGLVLYTSAALISALAGSLEMLTLGRALQGLGAAGIMSVNTALIRYTYPRRQLGRGIALTSLVVSTSSAAGPTVAAAILSITSWIFDIAVKYRFSIAVKSSGCMSAVVAVKSLMSLKNTVSRLRSVASSTSREPVKIDA